MYGLMNIYVYSMYIYIEMHVWHTRPTKKNLAIRDYFAFTLRSAITK